MYEDYETVPDENGIKFIITHKMNSEGKMVRITKKTRVRTIISDGAAARKKRIEERQRGWKKFGKCVNSNDAGVTLRGEEIFLALGDDGRRKKEKMEQEKRDKQELDMIHNSLLDAQKKMICGTCSSLPTQIDQSVWKPSWLKNGERPPEIKSVYVPPHRTNADATTAYVPPHKKNPDATPTTAYVPPHKKTNPDATPTTGYVPPHRKTNFDTKDTITTIRVSNLSEEINETDLSEMFQKFGRILRINLVKDKLTGASREFAFITFADRQDAQNAMDKMDKQGLNNLIIRIEWAEK
uniref:RRM domain-containing protein n=1 Tax=viral metagenome TaxID=1070528 RepID=A0A6C0C7C1_9ZZZZ